jgi:hypothetical protein
MNMNIVFEFQEQDSKYLEQEKISDINLVIKSLWWQKFYLNNLIMPK